MSTTILLPSSGSDSEAEDISPLPPMKGKSTGDMKADFPKEDGTTAGRKDPKMWTLEKKRQVRVKELCGQKLVNISDYYTEDGQESPENNGVSLTVEQWKELKEIFHEVNKAI